VKADGSEVEGNSSILAAVARMAPAGSALLGAGPAGEAEVQQWLGYRNTELEPMVDSHLAPMNTILLTRTYICGSLPTIADFALYGSIAPVFGSFTAPQLADLPNLVRWYDLCQHSMDRSEVFPRVSVPKPFVALPSLASLTPAPVEKPDKKKAGDVAAAGGEKKKTKGGSEAAAPAPSSSSSSSTTATASAAPAKDETKKSNEGGTTGESKKKEKKEKKEKPAVAAAPAAATAPDVSALDIRVGTIVSVKQHPDADSLYLEEIDLGEEKPRQVISGLVKFIPLEKMENRKVVVICNFKPAKMRGILSSGMVLCASNDDHTSVDPIIPPDGVPNGERVTFAGYEGEPMAEINESKKKVFATCAPDLIVSPDGTCTYKGVPFMTSKGTIKGTIIGAHIA